MNLEDKQKKKPTVRKSTRALKSSRVFTEVEEFRVESWTSVDVKELAQDMGWNFNQKGNQYE